MADPRAIAAVVLAAGASRRFGENKLLHPLTRGGVTLPLAAYSLLPWLETFAQVTVVVKPMTQTFCRAIETALGTGKSAAIRWIVCDKSAHGMAFSLACGVGANRHAAAWVIGLADMPAVPAAAIAGVRNALLDGAALAAPYHDGRRGHPVGFAAQYREELLALRGDGGARHLLERDISHIAHVATDNDGVFSDIDTLGDLQEI